MTQPEKLFTAGQVTAALAKAGSDVLLAERVRLVLVEKTPEGHEARTLRYKLKTKSAELGKMGPKIYELRCQLAEVRGLIPSDTRSSYRILRQQLKEQRDISSQLRTQLQEAATDWVPRQQLDYAHELLKAANQHLEALGVKVTAPKVSEAYVEVGRSSGGLTL